MSDRAPRRPSGRLARRLVLAFLFVGLVPLGLLAGFGPRIVKRHFADLSRQRITGTLAGVRHELELRRDNIRVQVSDLAVDPEIVRQVALVGPSGTPGLSLIDHVVERRNAIGLDWLEVTDKAGIVLARGHARGDFAESLATDPLIAAAIAGQALTAIAPLATPDSGLALLAAAPVTFEGQFIGVVRGCDRLDRAFASRLATLSGAAVAVIDSAGHEGATTFPVAIGNPVALEDSLTLRRRADGSVDSTREVTLDDVPYRVGDFQLEGTGGRNAGKLVVGVSESDLANTLASLLRLLGAAALIALLVGIAVALIFALRVSRPVRALALAAQRMGHGDLAVRLPAGPNDEVGELMAAFNAMAVDIAGARERLIATERQAAWAQVARRLAHDIKNPLTPIQLAIEEVEAARIAGDPDLANVITRAAKTIKAEVRVLRELVKEFGDFARSPEPRLEPIDVHELLDHAIDLYVPGSVAVERDYGLAEGRMVGDPDLLARAFGNLVKNACEAMEGRGTLSVSTRADDRTAEIVIQDSGPGIPPGDRQKVFTPYFTTKPEGTGLGLAIVQRVVDDHGGALALHSTPQGARFVLRFPEVRRG